MVFCVVFYLLFRLLLCLLFCCVCCWLLGLLFVFLFCFIFWLLCYLLLHYSLNIGSVFRQETHTGLMNALLRVTLSSQSACKRKARPFARIDSDAVCVIDLLPTLLSALLPIPTRDFTASIIENYSIHSHAITEIPETVPINLQIQIL